MAGQKDNTPKVFREMACTRCGQIFQTTGPCSKRCDPCKRLHKQEYERNNKRAANTRLVACSRCAKPFDGEAHGHQRYCQSCAKAVHTNLAIEANLRRYREVYRHDPGYRLHLSVSVLVRRALKQEKGGRSWESLVGYTREQLMTHIQRQFTKGMTWQNLGKWHIDHILPRAMFKFKTADDPEFKACWALTNLRPLWALLNQSKNDNRFHLI